MESGNVLLSQVFPHVLDPPLAAHMGEPNQVQCRTLVGIIRKTKLSGYMKRKTHPHGQVFLFMESGNVLLSQVVAARTPCHAARVLCHASKSSEYAKSRPFYATSGFLIYAVFTPFQASDC